MAATVGETEGWWHIASRWLEYEGELRVALIRVALVAAFYSSQLIHYILFSDQSVSEQVFHRQATHLAAGWLFVSLAVLVALTRQWLPSWLKYLTSGFDLALLTLLSAAGSGPASPLIFVFGIVIAMSAMRGSIRLIWCVTLGSMICYWSLVGLRDKNWFDTDHTTPPIQQMVVLLSLAATGIVLSQLVRMMRQVLNESGERVRLAKARDS